MKILIPPLVIHGSYRQKEYFYWEELNGALEYLEKFKENRPYESKAVKAKIDKLQKILQKLKVKEEL